METAFVELEAQQVRTAHSAVRTMRRTFRIAFGAARWAAVLLAFAAAVGLGVLPHLGVYRTLTVLSASMEPTFAPGDVVLVRPEPIRSLRVGQVISYAVPVGAHQVETHRVFKILSGRGTAAPTIQTKGDNNTVPDPWTAQLHGDTVYRLRAVVPKAGYVINAMRGRLFHLLSVVLIPALLALVALGKLWGLGGTRARGGQA